MLKKLWCWLKRLFHRPITNQIPFHYQPMVRTHFAKNTSMIVRAGKSMRRGRLLGVK